MKLLDKAEQSLQSLFERFSGPKSQAAPIPPQGSELTSALQDQLKSQPAQQTDLPIVINLVLPSDSFNVWKEREIWQTWLFNAASNLARENEIDISFEPEINLVEDPDLTQQFQLLLTHKSADHDSTIVMLTDELNRDLQHANSAELILPDDTHFEISESGVKVGRAESNDLIIADLRVSREHAVIRPVEAGFAVIDLSSTGGTLINGYPVQQSILQPGDVISFAGYQVIFTLRGGTSSTDYKQSKTSTTLIDSGAA